MQCLKPVIYLYEINLIAPRPQELSKFKNTSKRHTLVQYGLHVIYYDTKKPKRIDVCVDGMPFVIEYFLQLVVKDGIA